MLFLLSTDDNNSILLQVEHIRKINLLLNRLLLSLLCLSRLIESLKLTPLIDVPEDEVDGTNIESEKQLLLIKCVSEIHKNRRSDAKWNVTE